MGKNIVKKRIGNYFIDNNRQANGIQIAEYNYF